MRPTMLDVVAALEQMQATSVDAGHDECRYAFTNWCVGPGVKTQLLHAILEEAKAAKSEAKRGAEHAAIAVE